MIQSAVHRIRRQSFAMIGTALLTIALSTGFTCNSKSATQNLATASDAIAHALVNAQTAAQQATTAGVMSQADFTAFNTQLSNVATAGQQLDAAIRANESATSVAQKVTNFMAAFNTLQQSGVIGIKDANTKLAISTIITGAESSVAIIAATVGTTGAASASAGAGATTTGGVK